MSKTTLEVLIDARKLIEKPEDWAKGAACGLTGTPTCAGVAIELVGEHSAERERAHLLFRSLNGIPWSTITTWNDEPSRTHADVMAAFDLAIEAARAKAVA